VKASPPALPAVARSLLKSAIVGLQNAGLITSEQATLLLAVLELHDA
jgi:hypothetical protein